MKLYYINYTVYYFHGIMLVMDVDGYMSVYIYIFISEAERKRETAIILFPNGQV